MPPPSMAQYDFFRDQLAIKYPAYGHALWEPNAVGLRHAIEVGDVGFVLQGKFIRLFNALLPANHPSHANSGVPESHEPLKPSIADHIDSSTVRPESLCSAGVTEYTCNTGSVASRMAGLGPGLSAKKFLSCNNKRGVALLLPARSQREDTVAKGEFAEWMVKHIDRWFSFAKSLYLGIERMEDIILVTGSHRTKSWANVAFFETHGGFLRRAPMQVSLGIPDSRNPSSHFGIVWTFRRGPCQGVILNMVPGGRALTKDKCVFIRGFRVTRTHQVLNRFRDRQPISTTTVTAYRDPLSSLLEYIADKDPHSDMVLVHDDDLARFNEISPISLETLQQHEFLAHLQEVQPKIQRVLSGPLSAKDGQRVAILSNGRQERSLTSRESQDSGTPIPSDQSAPTSGIGRNLLSFLSKVPRKSHSPTSQQVPQHDNASAHRTGHDTGRNLDAPIRLSAYIADVDYAPAPSPLTAKSKMLSKLRTFAHSGLR